MFFLLSFLFVLVQVHANALTLSVLRYKENMCILPTKKDVTDNMAVRSRPRTHRADSEPYHTFDKY